MQQQQIHPNESVWLSTFPHLVAPKYDEWLPGLLLRCDKANGWSSGTTLAHILRSITSSPLRGKPSWIVVPRSVLELLAQLLALPVSELEGTTYNAELVRLYNTPHAHATYLDRSPRFHLCPVCIAEKLHLKRIFALPHISCCPLHQIQLVGKCRCNTPLQFLHRQAYPFTCHNCSLNWARLPCLSAEQEILSIEHKFLLLYEFFFTEGTPMLLTKALQLVRVAVKRKRTPWVKSPKGTTRYVECYDGKRVSLGRLVELLVGLDLSPHDIMAYEGSIPWWSVQA